MSKDKGYDFIADAHERANHNINPYYWTNRVTSFTLAQWRTNRYFAPLFFVLYSTIVGSIYTTIYKTALKDHVSFWSLIFDFTDPQISARFLPLFLFTIFWIISGLGTIRVMAERIYRKESAEEIKPKKEKKKKYPKRPKNYR